MADNVPISAGAGTSIATDDVGGVHFQKGKLDAGGDGVSVPIVAGQQVAAASLPVVLASDGTLIPGTSASALGKAEDAAHASGDVGVMALGVRKDTAAALAGTDGDYQPAIYDANGRLHVINSAGIAGDVAHDAVDAGNPQKIGGKASSTAPTAVANGDRVDGWFSSNGAQIAAGVLRTPADGAANGSGMGFPVAGDAAAGYALINYPFNFNGTTWNRQRSAYSDAIAEAGLAAAAGMRFNGTTWDREYGNTEGTLLASAARTTSTSSAVQTNYNARGVVLFLNVTVAGTGNLNPSVSFRDPVDATTFRVVALSINVTTTGLYLFMSYPGTAAVATGTLQAGVIGQHGAPLPRIWRGGVNHSDASSWTYSLGFSYVI